MIEHAPKEELGSYDSAPKSLQVWTWNAQKWSLFGVGELNLARSSAVSITGKEISTQSIQVRILSNWGRPEYTCLYRVAAFSVGG